MFVLPFKRSQSVQTEGKQKNKLMANLLRSKNFHSVTKMEPNLTVCGIYTGVYNI